VRVQFRESGRTALTVSSDSLLRLWDVESGHLAGAFGGVGRLLTSDLSEDGAALLLARQTASRESVLRTFMLDRPAEARRFVNDRLPAARRALRDDPTDPAALRTLGEWYAFRGLDETALSFFERANVRDPNGPALPLARCYWNLDRPSDAAREFAR
jgi:hypothetical protein